MVLAVGFGFLAASGIVLVRSVTQKVPAPTSGVFTVLSGMVLVAGLALILNSHDMESLTVEAIGWITLMGIMAYPMIGLLLVTSISMVGASRSVPMCGIQPVIVLTLGVILLGGRPNLLITMRTSIIHSCWTLLGHHAAHGLPLSSRCCQGRTPELRACPLWSCGLCL